MDDTWHNRAQRSQGNGLQTPYQVIQNGENVMRLGTFRKKKQTLRKTDRYTRARTHTTYSNPHLRCG